MKDKVSSNQFYLEAFGVRIKQLRKERRLTQEQLANLSGLSRVSVYQIERGQTNPSLLTLLALAEALGCDMSTLVSILRVTTAPQPLKPTHNITVYTQPPGPLFTSHLSKHNK